MFFFFAENSFKYIFFNENFWISFVIIQKFIPNSQVDNRAALVQVLACCQTGNKPLPEPMLLRISLSLTLYDIDRPQWVNHLPTWKEKQISLNILYDFDAFMWLEPIGHVTLVAINVTTNLVPYHLVYPLELILYNLV